VANLAERLLRAAVAALPLDPDVDEPETLIGWEVVTPTVEERAAEPCLPEQYSMPGFGPAGIVAARVAVAVLRVLVADHGSSLSPNRRSHFEGIALELEHHQLIAEATRRA
jgi:hypothetical protein